MRSDAKNAAHRKRGLESRSILGEACGWSHRVARNFTMISEIKNPWNTYSPAPLPLPQA
jgi:hypothetical protein